ncbi:helix-turn-helix domain-containing protein [Streptomyces sp. 8N616]|uniref:helix-turn-helix domain-containing protein n=1 Tax=Streptomyces sp. 8N616 TaxID=3457414 RepID=UPI003FD2CAE5
MPASGDVAEFAALMHELKTRANRSYAALAKRTGLSGSALHRYCSGAGVPHEYTSAERIARVCGATPEELAELHKLWVLADAEWRRRQPRAGQSLQGAPGNGAADEPAPAAEHSTRTEEAAGERAGVRAGEVAERAPSRPPVREFEDPTRWLITGGLALALVAFVTLAVAFTPGAGEDPAHPAGDPKTGSSGKLLLSTTCPVVLSMGEEDACVRETQQLLAKAGASLDIDGMFGPVTQMRVIVFQLFAGLNPNGIVDERTKRALYEGKVRLRPWSAPRLERRIREVFAEEPDRAVGIARCQSHLDALFSLANSNGTRNWGVFQLSDRALRELGGTRLQALDPEWNIRAARRLWSRTKDFRAWTCNEAYETASPSPTATRGAP